MNNHAKTRVRLNQFTTSGYDRGKPAAYETAWYLCKCIFFLSALPWPSSLKVTLLRTFGAKVGKSVVIKPRVNFHMPWKLEIGDFSWFGEEAFLLNLERIEIGAHCCISQRAFLCTGNHDYRDPSFRYRSQPIIIRDGAWIGAGAFIGPGVIVGVDTVCCSGTIVSKNLEPGIVYAGNPAVPVRQRWKS